MNFYPVNQKQHILMYLSIYKYESIYLSYIQSEKKIIHKNSDALQSFYYL